MVRIYVFHNGTVGNKTNTNAQQVWFETEHADLEYIYSVDAQVDSNYDFIEQFEVDQFPTIVFVNTINEQQGLTLTRIEGPASKEQIRNVLNAALDGNFGSGTDGNITSSVIIGDGDELSLGLGIFNLSIPNLFFWIIGGIAVYGLIKEQEN